MLSFYLIFLCKIYPLSLQDIFNNFIYIYTYTYICIYNTIFKVAELLNGRLKGYFVSENIFNLSDRKLSKAEVSLLSKGLKFCPTPNTIDKSILKEDLEKFGRKLRLKWHYRNDNRIFDPDPFKLKSNFNPPKSDAAIELYFSRLEDKLLDLGPIKHRYNNLTGRKEKLCMI